MRKFFSGLFLSLSLFTLLAGSASAQLQSGKDQGFSQYFQSTFGGVYQVDKADLKSTLPGAIGSIISIVLGFTGVILLVIMVYAGILWLTAGGNEDQVAHAKQLIKNGVIGLAITLSAFIITSFVTSNLSSILTNSAAQPSGGTPPRSGG